jgi:hypothetical protein
VRGGRPAAPPVAGPKLEDLPGPTTDATALPAPAQWPVLRYEQPLRILAVHRKFGSIAAYQRIARRMRSTLSTLYPGAAGDAIYHVNDKWIEPEKDPTHAELDQYIQRVVREGVAPRDGKPPADVIFATLFDSSLLKEPGLLASVNAGATLVACGSHYPEADSPFAPEWPAKPMKQSVWMDQSARRSEGAVALSGVPVEWLSGWDYCPIAEPTPGSVALSANRCGSVYTRKVGAGTIIFAPTGPISRFHSAIASFGRKYDHDEIWLRLWDQLLYETVRGPGAIPAFSDLAPGAKEAAPGQVYALPGRILNRTARGPLAVSVHVTTPRGAVVYSTTESLEAPAGGTKAYDVKVPVAADWPAGVYPVYLTVGDPVAKKQFHQSMEFVPVAGQVRLALKADKKGYRLGEPATFTLTASSGAPWSGTLSFGLYDFRGRLLGAASQPATLASTDPQPFTFRAVMADHGVRVDTLWAEVVARKDGHDWGRAEAKIYKYEPWSMRNEYQWSTWAGIACRSPSVVPRGMELMAHAGMNALGYPGRPELYYAGERWGWRSYNEGVGTNTFSPVIEYENDAEIERALSKEAEHHLESHDANSPTLVLASIGEEAGYKNGWGTTYYWPTPVASDKACRAFQWFLKDRYGGDLGRLNATWKTAFPSWDDVKLTKEFSARHPKLAADGWAHPKESPLGPGVEAVSLAPYADTDRFYGWYYDRIVAVAKRILRERINPVTLTMSSAPSGFNFNSRECDTRNASTNGWNDSQSNGILDGPEPGFSLQWGHFDWLVKTESVLWGFLLARSGHNNFWVDVPLMFNADLTHTRASFALRQWTNRFQGHERIILDSLPAPSDVGVLLTTGLGQDFIRGNMFWSLEVGLLQGGFGTPANDLPKGWNYYDPLLRGAGLTADLLRSKILFAVGRQAVSKEEADRLDAFVKGGGTLVLTSRFATQDGFGAPLPATPGQGLAEKWGLQTRPKAKPSDPNKTRSFALDGLGESYQGFKISARQDTLEDVEQTGWTSLARYEDGTPALLTRTQGKGSLYYVNALYESHSYARTLPSTGAERQGFYKLIEYLCEKAGVRRTLKLEGDLSQMLHVAVKEFTDPTGDIRYAVLRTDGAGVPWVAGALEWLGPQTAGYDVLEKRALGRDVPIRFKPSSGKLLAFVEKPLQELVVEPTKSRITAGEPFELTVRILAADGSPVRGRFPIEIGVKGPSGAPIEGLRRSVSLPCGGKISINTALSDPAGPWTVTATDGISSLSGSAALSVTAAPGLSDAPGFVPWGWPSEIFEPAILSDDRFVEQLVALGALYRADQSAAGWMAKQRLGYFYDYFPDTRHALLEPLLDLDWANYMGALRKAVSGGAELILTGEDLGIHPGSGLAVYPHHDAGQFAALLGALDGSTWSTASTDGDTLVASLGKGRVILSRESVDAAGHDNPSAVRWQRRWLGELRPDGVKRIAAPSLSKLQLWWMGRESLASGRTVTWFEGNHRELKIRLGPDRPLGEAFSLVVPPTGDVREVVVEVTGPGADTARFDVGCNNVADPDWRKAAASYARTAPHRDDNGWRIIPVRVTGKEKGELQLRIERIIVE